MAWQIIFIAKAARLSLKNSQLCYKLEEETLYLPVEDISVIILESTQISLTQALLAKCAEFNVAIFSCDEKHLPNGVFLPFSNHSRYAQGVHKQIAASEPLKKRLWQKIIQAKILNQAFVIQDKQDLSFMAKKVLSGDSSNVEALVARLYFSTIAKNFKREDENIQNAALNYGYSILRGVIARNIVAYSLLPAFGIHHCNQFNNFNLADDLIEPFRPFIDNEVFSMHFAETELTPPCKHALVNILNKQCYINNEQLSLLRACEICVRSFAKCIKEGSSDWLLLPAFKGN